MKVPPSDILGVIGAYLCPDEWMALVEVLPEETRLVSYPHRINLSKCLKVVRYNGTEVPFTEITAGHRWQNLQLQLPSADIQKTCEIATRSDLFLKELSLECNCTSSTGQCHDLFSRGLLFKNVEALDVLCEHFHECAAFKHNFPKLRRLEVCPLSDGLEPYIQSFIARHPKIEDLSIDSSNFAEGLACDPITDQILSIRIGLDSHGFEGHLAQCTRNRRAVVRARRYSTSVCPTAKFPDRRYWRAACYGSPMGKGNECRSVYNDDIEHPSDHMVSELFQNNQDGFCFLPLSICRAAFARYEFMIFKRYNEDNQGNDGVETLFDLSRNLQSKTVMSPGWTEREVPDEKRDRRCEIVVFVQWDGHEEWIQRCAYAHDAVYYFIREADGRLRELDHPEAETPNELLARLERQKAPHLSLVHQMVACFGGELDGTHWWNVGICGIVDRSVTDDDPPTPCSLARLESLPLRQRCWDLPGSLVGFDLAMARREPQEFQKDLATFRDFFNR